MKLLFQGFSRFLKDVGAMYQLPVDDAMSVQIHKCKSYFSSIEPGPGFIKFTSSLNLEHEITSIYIFHHKEKSILKKDIILGKTYFYVLNYL